MQIKSRYRGFLLITSFAIGAPTFSAPTINVESQDLSVVLSAIDKHFNTRGQ